MAMVRIKLCLSMVALTNPVCPPGWVSPAVVDVIGIKLAPLNCRHQAPESITAHITDLITGTGKSRNGKRVDKGLLI